MPDNERPWSHAVVVTALHGEKYLGWIDSKEDKPRDCIELCVEESDPLLLLDVRILATQIQQGRDPKTGQMVTGNMVFLMPLDAFPSACPSLKLLISSWYFPVDEKDCLKIIQQLLVDCKRIEEINTAARSAAAAGITIALPGTRLPPPPGVH